MKKMLGAAVLATMLTTSAWAEGLTHRVAIHVDENDPQVMNMALNNVANLISYYESVGDTAIVEVVSYGPGLNMFIADTSPVASRISAMSLEMENLSFAACGNTLEAMTKKAGKDIALMSEASVVPSGVVGLIELQEQDYAYVRP